MAREIIVEFPTPLTDKEKKMIYGYKGEVVRCRDCKYYDSEYRYCTNVPDIWTKPNGYCSWGERKETETKEEQS